MNVTCPACSGKMAVADHMAGQRIKCGYCEAPFFVPSNAETAPLAPSPADEPVVELHPVDEQTLTPYLPPSHDGRTPERPVAPSPGPENEITKLVAQAMLKTEEFATQAMAKAQAFTSRSSADRLIVIGGILLIIGICAFVYSGSMYEDAARAEQEALAENIMHLLGPYGGAMKGHEYFRVKGMYTRATIVRYSGIMFAGAGIVFLALGVKKR